MKVFYRKQNFDQNVAWDDHDFPKRREAIEEGCRRYYEINGNKSLFGDINVESLVLWKLHDLHSSRYRNLRLKSGKQKLTQSKYALSRLFCFHDCPKTLQPWTLTISPLRSVSMLYEL